MLMWRGFTFSSFAHQLYGTCRESGKVSVVRGLVDCFKSVSSLRICPTLSLVIKTCPSFYLLLHALAAFLPATGTTNADSLR